MACAIEDAGFEVRDQLAWTYGSGFPKSLDVSKAIDKAAGVWRGTNPDFRNGPNTNSQSKGGGKFNGYPNTGILELDSGPATPDAREWQGYGTAIKPAWEPICLARKPLSEKTVAANVLKWGTGALNVDGCRVGISGATTRTNGSNAGKERNTLHGGNFGVTQLDAGRWPANLIHDGSDEVVGLFPDTKSGGGDKHSKTQDGNIFKGLSPVSGLHNYQSDSGSAARFFYCAKTSKSDRNDGCDDLPDSILAMSNQAKAEVARGNSPSGNELGVNNAKILKNNHPTVKPTSLMQYLCRLITPPGGIILDPFMGSGSTGKAAAKEGRSFIGIERDPSYFSIAQARISAAIASQPQPPAEQQLELL
jgi:site-specific DNA-methyltransferase (adenine-specific)